MERDWTKPTFNTRIFLSRISRSHIGSGTRRRDSLELILSDHSCWTAREEYLRHTSKWAEEDEVFLCGTDHCDEDGNFTHDADEWMIVNITRSIGDVSKLWVLPAN
ncbi:MAG: hypothetical protein CMO80_04045 [Verrucomicrobiales bacterium]|nr:hypothetical protein [Verrucomicrobiales bacterium]